jgi:aquaporin Z
MRTHWPEYLIEALLLGLFMLSACTFATLIGHPASALHAALGNDVARRMLMGTLMGATAVTLIYSPPGRRSGAHLNPATTLTFYRLGRVAPRDALAYVVAQFVGGTLGVLLARGLIGPRLADPAVDYATTMPGPLGASAAFAGEVAITFVLMSVVLRANASPRWMRYTGVLAGCLVAAYITLEAPISGMSMNPARSFASAFGAGHWSTLWIYFVAPLLGMLAAAEVFVRAQGRAAVPCPKMAHATPCIFCGHRVDAGH